MTDYLSLYELNSIVKETIEDTLTRQYWVEAELSDTCERRGHLFTDLIEKDTAGNGLRARAAAKCWASTWLVLRKKFENVTRQPLCNGMKVLLRVYAQYHTAYGFSWIITDIDPTFTLGDMARRRMEIIAKLKKDGVFDMQRQLHLPLFCQRIAVISSEHAAGYGDFCHQLHDNTEGFMFHTTLFPAIMQGERVEDSVVTALNHIFEQSECFDCVVIIRGGGATTDMSGFDSLVLAENVANFPLPIITGIGHDRDECILDMISHIRVKTPTAAAAYLISHLSHTAEMIEGVTVRITKAVAKRIEQERMTVNNISSRIPILFSLVKVKQENRIESIMQRIENILSAKTQKGFHTIDLLDQRLSIAVQRKMELERSRLALLSQRTEALDPERILKRGFSMTLSGGKIVTDASQLAEGEVLETRLAHGTVFSKKI